MPRGQVGLAAHNMSDLGMLAQLAAHPTDTSREEIYLAVASLYRIHDGNLSARERGLMQDILRRTAKDVEISVRITLAEELADDVKAPHELIVHFTNDDVEVARPLLLRSPKLSDEDLLRVISECSVEHHQIVAQRQNISETVTDVLSRAEPEAVLLALVQNTSARISPLAYDTLVEKSRSLPTLCEPLAGRGEAATRNHPPKSHSADGAQKLVDKLAASGQLKAGFLVRVLNQGQTDLFDLALAKLVDLPLTELRSRFYRGGPRAVALACRGVGIDRCVFPTVFSLSRLAHNMGTKLSFDELAEVDRVFATVPKTSALSELSSLTFN
jgi:uncharacterized protein (DUF2336 family)